MPDLILLLLTGCMLGVRHAMDADHVVAVTTIVSRQRSLWGAVGTGALWGLGHTGTICLVGAAIIGLRLSVPARLGLGLEFGVALMLIGLGLRNLLQRPAAPAAPAARAPLRPVAVGMIHGLAGSAAVALMVLAAIDRPAWGAAYLLLFGAGTTIGMVLVTAAVALPSLYAAARVPRMERYLQLASGAVSLALGLFLAHQIGVVDGLFGDAPRWDPH